MKKSRSSATPDPGDAEPGYRRALYGLQVQLVKYQRHLIAHGDRIAVVLEGRDAAGKDGVIKRIVEHLSPRETRVVALPAPSSREQTEWYFQRYVEHLPAAREFVLFNRSWYNRAGVERVFEQMLANAGIRVIKYYLDINRDEQVKRLIERRRDPLSQWKLSPIDKVASKKWDAYTDCRDEMLRRTHSAHAPWHLVRADDKHHARLNVIRHLLSLLSYRGKDRELLRVDPEIVFAFDEARLHDGSIAR
jgi:polyphosphate kinase